jgi:hypothetical protein
VRTCRPCLSNREQDFQRFVEARPCLLGGNAKAAQLLHRRGPAHADLNAALAEDVERRHSLGDPNRVVVGEWEEHHRVPDAHRAGQLADCAVQDFWGRGVGEPGLIVVLHRPEVGEPVLLGERHLLQHVVKRLVLAFAMFQRTVNLNLVEDPKIDHLCPLFRDPTGRRHGLPVRCRSPHRSGKALIMSTRQSRAYAFNSHTHHRLWNR